MKKQSGFSLIEILVVLVIMGLLISVVAPTVLNSADDARIQKVQADFKSIETALKIYRLDNYVYPTTSRVWWLWLRRQRWSLSPETSKKATYPRCPWTHGVGSISICRPVSMGKSIFIPWVRMAAGRRGSEC